VHYPLQVASPSVASETSQEDMSEPSTPRFATPAKGRKGKQVLWLSVVQLAVAEAYTHGHAVSALMIRCRNAREHPQERAFMSLGDKLC